ncbi:MAG TPA: prohibitin family protein [Gemmatimonadetes bacterium]|nr:prohibitin family protein [Gemmatimonadota bacterium]
MIIPSIFLIVVGAVVFVVGPKTAKPGAAGQTRLAGLGAMIGGLVLMLSNGITVIGVGEVGVKHFLGRISTAPLEQGVHVMNPFASIEKMSVREQAYPLDGGVEQIEAQTSEQLNVSLEISILFRLDGDNAPDLFQRLGTEAQIKRSIVLNAVRNGVRDAVATKSINQIFSPDRREVATDMLREIQAKAGDRIEVLDVFVRDVQAPATVRQAIEDKLAREQQVASEAFQTDIIRERAQQAIEEAKGVAEAQLIITEGLTPAYLTYHYIEQLSLLPAGSVVYVPTEGGIPLMRSLGGGGN